MLVVDDEASVRTVTQQTLATFGFRVIAARDGAEAVARYEREGDDIDLVITDLMMPKMDGLQTMDRLRVLDPEVAVIAVSGLGGGERLGQAEAAGARRVLSKPYATEVLLRAVLQVLGRSADGEGS